MGDNILYVDCATIRYTLNAVCRTPCAVRVLCAVCCVCYVVCFPRTPRHVHSFLKIAALKWSLLFSLRHTVRVCARATRVIKHTYLSTLFCRRVFCVYRYLAHVHDIELEGACEASVACSTCHVYVDQESYNKLNYAEEEEEDMYVLRTRK